jgi:hypothetical protein
MGGLAKWGGERNGRIGDWRGSVMEGARGFKLKGTATGYIYREGGGPFSSKSLYIWRRHLVRAVVPPRLPLASPPLALRRPPLAAGPPVGFQSVCPCKPTAACVPLSRRCMPQYVGHHLRAPPPAGLLQKLQPMPDAGAWLYCLCYVQCTWSFQLGAAATAYMILYVPRTRAASAPGRQPPVRRRRRGRGASPGAGRGHRPPRTQRPCRGQVGPPTPRTTPSPH